MSQTFYKNQTPQGQQSFSARGGRNIFNNNSFSPVPGSFQDGTTGSQTIRTVNPFVTNPHAHPSFTPAKLGGKGVGDRLSKQPKPPDKPLMPYMRYSRKVSRLVWDSIKASNPDLKLWEIGKIIGQMWRELSNSEKQEYIDEYDVEKLQYNEAMKQYHSSAAYQAWIASKGKQDADADVDEQEKTATRRSSKVIQHKEVTESRIISSSMPTNEEEDDMEDAFSMKNVAAARYYRNHCLINDIFSDVVIPDGRSVINEARMNTLKKQVNSLTMHQKKLEGELEQIEERHRFKKQKLGEANRQFNAQLDKLNKMGPVVTKEIFDEMVEKAKDELMMNKKREDKQLSEEMSEDAAAAAAISATTAAVDDAPTSHQCDNKPSIKIDEQETSTVPPVLTPSIHIPTSASTILSDGTPDSKSTAAAGEGNIGSHIITSPISDVADNVDKMDVDDDDDDDDVADDK